MGIARRQFLQAGMTSLIGWQFLTRDRVAFAAEQYVRQATASTQRKRALLVGINQYGAKEDTQNFSQKGASTGWLPLQGCINDVELQKELLIYRFGFAPQDIVTLRDREATHNNIFDAITEHLTAQTLPDDLVVIHFSGLGSRLGNYNTLVPVDSDLPKNLENLNDITEQEWRGWLQAIATNRLLCIIDAGFYYPNVSAIGNFRLRSRIGLKNWKPLTEIEPSEQSTVEKPPIGTTLRAVSGDMLCVDAQWSGFSSGAFTYALVQQMWQLTSATTIYVVMGNVATTLDRKAIHNDNLTIDKQIVEMVEIDAAKQKAIASSTFEPFLTVPLSGCDGVIVGLTDERQVADVCLAGLPIAVLSNYTAGSILNVMSAVSSSNNPSISNHEPENIESVPKLMHANPLARVLLKSRDGFNGKVEVLSDRSSIQKLETGQLLQEAVRAISHNVKLAIALDLGLSKIERVDATRAFSTFPNMFGVNTNEQSNEQSNEQFADCLFGVQSASYGLFTVGHTPILGSFGSVGESVSAAIKRLQPFLEGLFAAKLIGVTENQSASHLDVRVTLKAIIGVDERSVTIASKSSARANLIPFNSTLDNTIRTKPINIGDRLECQIENFSDRPLYVKIFCLDPRSKILTPHFIVIPYANDGMIPPYESLTIPYPKASINWAVSAPKGMVDIQVVTSRSPLLQVSQILETSQRQSSSLNGLIAIPNPLQVAQALLDDLDRNTQLSDFGSLSNISDVWMLDLEQWATFTFNYQVA